jgi:hypothetical protein
LELKKQTEALITKQSSKRKLNHHYKKLHRKQIQERRIYTKVNINVVPDTSTVNQVNMVVNIDKGEKIKLLKLIL